MGLEIGIDIVGLSEKLEELVRARELRGEVVEANGRTFIYNDQEQRYVEVQERLVDEAAYLAPVEVVDLTSGIRWALEAGTDGEVRLSRSRATVFATPRRVSRRESRDEARKLFYCPHRPPAGEMTFDQFLNWCEDLAPLMEPSEAKGLIAALQMVSAADSSVTKVVMNGARMSIHSAVDRDTQSSTPIPREIQATIPFGDPEFCTEVRFRLTATAKDKELRFRAHMVADEAARARWTEYACQRLAEELAGWTVLVVD